MMARARTDVDALNHRAPRRRPSGRHRAPARSSRSPAAGTGRPGTSCAPAATTAGSPSATAGTSATATGSPSSDPRPAVVCSSRTLPAAATPGSPASYLAEHATYGWACTIDGAQGATADLGILLARPGLDREHLYVGMTRGRAGQPRPPHHRTRRRRHRPAPAPRGGAHPRRRHSAPCRPPPSGSAPNRPRTPCTTRPAHPWARTRTVGLPNRQVTTLEQPRRHCAATRPIHRDVDGPPAWTPMGFEPAVVETAAEHRVAASMQPPRQAQRKSTVVDTSAHRTGIVSGSRPARCGRHRRRPNRHTKMRHSPEVEINPTRLFTSSLCVVGLILLMLG